MMAKCGAVRVNLNSVNVDGLSYGAVMELAKVLELATPTCAATTSA